MVLPVLVQTQASDTYTGIQGHRTCTGTDTREKAVLASYPREEGAGRTTKGETPPPGERSKTGQYHYQGRAECKRGPSG